MRGVGRLHDVVHAGGVVPPPDEHVRGGLVQSGDGLTPPRPQLSALGRPAGSRCAHPVRLSLRRAVVAATTLATSVGCPGVLPGTQERRSALPSTLMAPAPSRSVPAPGEAPMPAANGAALRRNAALRRPSGHPLRRADVDPRRLLHRELPVRPALPGPPAGWAVPRRRAPRQHARLPLRLGRRRRWRNGRRSQPHPAGEHLARDAEHADVGLLLTESRHLHELEPLRTRRGFDDDRVLVSKRFDDPENGDGLVGTDLAAALEGVPGDDPGLEPDPDERWALIFTSGPRRRPRR